MDIANSALLQEGDEVVLRGPVEKLPTADHGSRQVAHLPSGRRLRSRGSAAVRARLSSRRRTSGAGLPLLTRLLQVKMLSAQEAARGLPVRVRGVVTGASVRAPDGAQEIVLQDADCGVYATTETGTVEAAAFGSLVEIEGRTGPGAFAPIVIYSSLRVLGKGPLPQPLPVCGSRRPALSARTENMLGGGEGRAAAARGGVRRRDVEGEVPLYFFTGDTPSLQRLVDAEVEAPESSPSVHRARQVVGYRLLVQSPEQIVLVRPADDPGGLALCPSPSSSPTGRPADPLHRVMARGVGHGCLPPQPRLRRRRLRWPSSAKPPAPRRDRRRGQRVRLPARRAAPSIGSPGRGFAERKEAAHPVPAILTLEQLLGGEHDGRLLRVAGRLRERARSMGRELLTLEAGQRHVHGRPGAAGRPSPRSSAFASAASFASRASARWTGTAPLVPPRVRAARILLRSPADVELLRAASWWTRGRICGLLATVIALASVSLVWLVSLRRQVGSRPR